MKPEYTMKGRTWERISPEAKDLIKSMLEYKPINRHSAKQAYAHKWIKIYGDKVVDTELTKDILGNLKDFSLKCKLQ